MAVSILPLSHLFGVREFERPEAFWMRASFHSVSQELPRGGSIIRSIIQDGSDDWPTNEGESALPYDGMILVMTKRRSRREDERRLSG